MLAYFWLKLTNPDEVNATKWSIRLLLVISILVGLGTFGYFLSVKGSKDKTQTDITSDTALSIQGLTDKISELKNSQATNEQISEELAKINSELTKIRLLDQNASTDLSEESLSQIISDADKDVSTKKIKAKSGVGTINVYAEPTFSSRKVNTLSTLREYVYYEKNNGWYKVVLSENASGWVSSKEVEEVF